MFRLGVVPYLNALPLYRTLETRGEAEVLRAVPSRLSGVLARGECDAALIPVVDFLRGIGWEIISDACIGTKATGGGEVQSVLLFHRAPLEKLQSVAVDTSSHTSVALLKIILADGYGVLPAFEEHPPNLAQMLQKHEAALLIGDAALEAGNAVQSSVEGAQNHILDLGQAWKELTGRPFVFAAWVARRGLTPAQIQALSRVLNAARDEGSEQLSDIVAQHPNRTALPPPQIEKYLREAVEFHLSDTHRAGLEEFRRRCEKAELLCRPVHPL